MRNILIVIVLLLWLLLGYKMWSDYCPCCCQKETSKVTEAVTPVPVAKIADCTAGVVCFEDNSHDANYATRFASFRDSLRGLIGDGQKLKITGLYRSTESYSGSLANLGIHRADVVGKRFSGLSSDQIELASQQIVGRTLGLGERVSFDIVNVATAPKVASSTSIYFPFNSTRKLQGAEIESYLKQVATRVKASGERVTLVGHTDDIGGAASNQTLGMRRATIIKQYLVAQGVASSKVNVSSKGEANPVATNSTDDGRARNRRTELTIIK